MGYCRSMLDIVSIGSIQHLTDDDPIGIYYTIEGFKDGQIARIRKGNTFSRFVCSGNLHHILYDACCSCWMKAMSCFIDSLIYIAVIAPLSSSFNHTDYSSDMKVLLNIHNFRVKYQLNLVTPEDRKMVLSRPNNSQSPNSPLPVLKQSLVVHREWGNILKIRTKTSNFPIATIQKEMNSMRYWLHLEPNVDCCFVSAVAAYVLRKKIFGDKLPKVLKTQNCFTGRARRLSISFRRRKKPRPLRENLGNTAATSSTL